MLMMLVMGKAAPLLGTEVKRRGREAGKETSFGREGTDERRRRIGRRGRLPPLQRSERRCAGESAAAAAGKDDRICEDETWAGG